MKRNNSVIDSRKLINEMHELLGRDNKKLTVESLVFHEEDESDFDGETEFADDFASDMETPIPSGSDAEVKPLIDQIRLLALQGIAKLATTPESESYNTLKKIWQIVDKSVETEISKQKNSAK